MFKNNRRSICVVLIKDVKKHVVTETKIENVWKRK